MCNTASYFTVWIPSYMEVLQLGKAALNALFSGPWSTQGQVFELSPDFLKYQFLKQGITNVDYFIWSIFSFLSWLCTSFISIGCTLMICSAQNNLLWARPNCFSWFFGWQLADSKHLLHYCWLPNTFCLWLWNWQQWARALCWDLQPEDITDCFLR